MRITVDIDNDHSLACQEVYEGLADALRQSVIGTCTARIEFVGSDAPRQRSAHLRSEEQVFTSDYEEGP